MGSFTSRTIIIVPPGELKTWVLIPVTSQPRTLGGLRRTREGGDLASDTRLGESRTADSRQILLKILCLYRSDGLEDLNTPSQTSRR
ncbi:hypothetical protein AVEN_92602-1 [Araneus ventricosus]|uniref:Uncharacterized protein n=1 Tax=Araneus ventricosus TaxID=182803 RepID=A0A4Y2AIH8_ARAVE|nr:hypothetical protein AVEN_92602-1 [Araneus ventricosus]